MKRGTNFILPVTFDIDLDTVEKIEFYFKQSINVAEFEYTITIGDKKTHT